MRIIIIIKLSTQIWKQFTAAKYIAQHMNELLEVLTYFSPPGHLLRLPAHHVYRLLQAAGVAAQWQGGTAGEYKIKKTGKYSACIKHTL